MKHDVNSIISFYEESGRIRHHAILSGDYKAHNREAARLSRMLRLLKKDKALAEACIPQLQKSENVVVRMDAAACCLALGENADIGEKILKEISKDPTSGIFGFNAEMTLKLWKETGSLYVYQKIKEL